MSGEEDIYYQKYLKYKGKYMALKRLQEEQQGGLITAKSGIYTYFNNVTKCEKQFIDPSVYNMNKIGGYRIKNDTKDLDFFIPANIQINNPYINYLINQCYNLIGNININQIDKKYKLVTGINIKNILEETINIKPLDSEYATETVKDINNAKRQLNNVFRLIHNDHKDNITNRLKAIFKKLFNIETNDIDNSLFRKNTYDISENDFNNLKNLYQFCNQIIQSNSMLIFRIGTNRIFGCFTYDKKNQTVTKVNN